MLQVTCTESFTAARHGASAPWLSDGLQLLPRTSQLPDTCSYAVIVVMVSHKLEGHYMQTGGHCQHTHLTCRSPNLLLDYTSDKGKPRFHVRIADFGLARMLGPGLQARPSSGSISGTSSC
jgi:hypothetical protein